MCGINGIFAYHYASNGVDRAEILRTRDHMTSRGPDGAGMWISPDARIGFGHRRLAIIDLTDAGAQPMLSADGTLAVTFNGEIYNYREIRRALEAKGHVFRSRSDTEVLLHLYAEKGDDMVRDLRGMFAFGLWDAKRRRLLLARDPYGIKPLYYADDGWTLRFASQVKALLAGGAISREPDPAGVAGFYLFGSVPEPFTTFAAIRSVPAGTVVAVEGCGAEMARRYHSIGEVFARCERQTSSPRETCEREARAALLDSVTCHLVADVPVGAFLSAGIDSGALVGLMRDAGAERITSVTVAFEEFRGKHQDEAPLAAETARRYGVDHSVRVVTRSEFEADLPRIIEAMDQPTIDGVNTWFVAKAARERGLKVAVSGLGADELFGGYPSFGDIPKWVRTLWPAAFVPGLGRGTRALAGRVVEKLGGNPKSAGMLELGGTYAGAYLLRRGLFMPWELGKLMPRDMLVEGLRRLNPIAAVEWELAAGPRSPFGKVATLESCLYMRNQLLRDTDWASMAHALEVRVPLVDAQLLERMAGIMPSLPAGQGKRLLAAAPTRALPEGVVNRPKTGFTTPVETWMRQAALPRGRLRRSGDTTRGARTTWAREWSCVVHEMQQLAA